MTLIDLDPRFIPAVKDGSKCATTRPGKRDYKVGPAVLRAGEEHMNVSIVNVQYKLLKDITKEELLKDGFDSLESLMNDALLIYYPDLTVEDEVTITEFKYA